MKDLAREPPYLPETATLDEVYKAMLNLKVLWGTGALLGITLGIIQGAPATAWLFLAIFGVFTLVWLYYWLKLR